jgi:hypothetical protein
MGLIQRQAITTRTPGETDSAERMTPDPAKRMTLRCGTGT